MVEKIIEWVEEEPTLTLKQLCEKTYCEFSINVGKSTMHYTLEREVFTIKKVREMCSYVHLLITMIASC
jgi:transposase